RAARAHGRAARPPARRERQGGARRRPHRRRVGSGVAHAAATAPRGAPRREPRGAASRPAAARVLREFDRPPAADPRAAPPLHQGARSRDGPAEAETLGAGTGERFLTVQDGATARDKTYHSPHPTPRIFSSMSRPTDL